MGTDRRHRSYCFQCAFACVIGIRFVYMYKNTLETVYNSSCIRTKIHVILRSSAYDAPEYRVGHCKIVLERLPNTRTAVFCPECHHGILSHAWFLIALCTHTLRWHKQDCDRTNKDNTSCHVQWRIDDRRRVVDMLSDQRRYNAEETTPEACQSASSPSDRRWECLWCPAVKHSVEHTLEKVLHCVEPDV